MDSGEGLGEGVVLDDISYFYDKKYISILTSPVYQWQGQKKSLFSPDLFHDL
ncbi:hypothetical protein Cs308_0215 [Candidatus Chlamydia sanziniae]|uniref:Uncharacterized protein n=1 Tax=Candidatus Chlamydia sanziniae TaxID=1806891 RepID=A0A1A9HWT2_9CHLA|nr:hypothetical protein Cs308_0215 [Candidatus Chlamydia sanziniae]